MQSHKPARPPIAVPGAPASSPSQADLTGYAPIALVPLIPVGQYYNGMPMARGVVYQVIFAAANTSVAIPHKLNRIPVSLMMLDAGTNYLPAWKRTGGLTPWSSTSIFVEVATAVPSPGVWLWIF